ncbi:MAG: acetoin utilization protein AcuC [Pseudomonadota bacterium]
MDNSAGRAPRFVGAEIYRRSTYGNWHPLSIPRVSTATDLVRALGWLDTKAFVPSPRAKPKTLELWHDRAYLDALQAAEASGQVSDAVRDRHGLGTASNPVFPEMYRRPATAAGGSLLSGEMLADPGVIYHPAGGTHHGMPDRAAGFCYLNDPVLAILSLRRQGVGRIAYVDIDAHHGDGVEFAFRDDPETLVLSVHEERRWPFTGALEDRGAGQVWNLPVPAGFNDTEMRAVLDALILPRVTAHRPEAVVLQCGADAVTEDPLSRLTLSNNAHWNVVATLRPLAPRYLVLGGGGYNPWSVGRLWAGVWGVLTNAEIPDRVNAEAESVLRALTWRRLRKGAVPSEDWMTTLRDVPREGPLRDTIRARLATLSDRAVTWV